MKKGDFSESPRSRARKGSRVAELLKQPEEALYNTLQAGGVGEDAVKWVAARLCGSTAGANPTPSATKQENFRRRNSSVKIYEALQKKELGKQRT
ncbi:hypothetical protein ACSSS7_004379 [Eimeria intestinalis]